MQTELERCDRVDGLSLFENSQTHLSLLGTELINYLGQECPKQPLMIFDVNPGYQTKFPVQMDFNSVLQQIDVDNSHLMYMQYQMGANLFEETS